jgi:hypothetical protein
VMIGGGPAMKGEEQGTVMLLNANENTLDARIIGIQPDKPIPTFTLERTKPRAAKSDESGRNGE